MAIKTSKERIDFLYNLCKESVRNKKELPEDNEKEIERITQDDDAFREFHQEISRLTLQFLIYIGIFKKENKHDNEHGAGRGKTLIGYLWTYPNINRDSLSLGSGCEVCPHCGGEIEFRVLKNRRPRAGYNDPQFNVMIDTKPKDRRAYFKMLKK